MSELISQLGIDWRLLIAQLVNFLVLLIVLERFVYRPLLKVIDERKKQAEENNKREKNLETKLADISSLRENILTEARTKGDKLKAEILERADQSKELILESAKEEAKRLIEAEKRVFQDEIERIEESIEEEIGRVVAYAIEKGLADVLDEKERHKILEKSVEHFLSEYQHKKTAETK